MTMELYATDGSARPAPKQRVDLGYGYVGVGGQYGFKAANTWSYEVGTKPALVAELQAVWLLLTRQPPKCATTMTVLLDSEDAIRHLDAWAAGFRDMPKGYTAIAAHEKLHLRHLARMVEQHRDHVTFQQVKGHSGHLLNECADSLARIARRSLVVDTSCARWVPKKDSKRRARTLVEGFMADPGIQELQLAYASGGA